MGGAADGATVYTTFTKLSAITPAADWSYTGTTAAESLRVSNSGGRPSGTTTAKGFSVSRYA